MIRLIPHLRAFAISISRAADAEDLAQETAARAWRARGSYEPGTNFKAWAFTILRNQHTTLVRRAWRSTPLDPQTAEHTLIANDDPLACEELVDVRSAMLRLPFEQRQALALVGAAGLSYKEAAAICNCAEGTIKSRVNRARIQLLALLDARTSTHRARTDVPASRIFDQMIAEGVAMQRLATEHRAGSA